MDSVDIDKIKQILWDYSQIDGAYHKAWVIDQIARVVYGEQYEEFVNDYENGEDGEEYEWDCGIAP